MKKNFFFIVLWVALVAFATSCKPEKVNPLESPFDKVKGMSGTWVVTTATQIDEVQVTKNFPFQRLDLTSRLPYTNYKITFTVDENGNPSTYSVNRGTAPNQAPSIIPADAGTWSVDSKEFPSKVTFRGTGSSAPFTLNFGSVNTIIAGKLDLKLTRSQAGKAFVSYQYLFNKQ